MSKKKLKITKNNLKCLGKLAKRHGNSKNNLGINCLIGYLIDEENARLDEEDASPIELPSWKKQIELDEIEDVEKMAMFKKIAEKEGILLPDERLFSNAESLQVFIIMKIFLNDTALEKMCNKFLPFYEKLPLEDFAESIADLMKTEKEE